MCAGDRLADKAEVRRTYTASLSDLPDGAMADLDGVPHLVLGGRLLRWTPGGYAVAPGATTSRPVIVITPRATVAVLACLAYRPVLHETATRRLPDRGPFLPGFRHQKSAIMRERG